MWRFDITAARSSEPSITGNLLHVWYWHLWPGGHLLKWTPNTKCILFDSLQSVLLMHVLAGQPHAATKGLRCCWPWLLNTLSSWWCEFSEGPPRQMSRLRNCGSCCTASGVKKGCSSNREAWWKVTRHLYKQVAASWLTSCSPNSWASNGKLMVWFPRNAWTDQM